jgi:hypothetical protein
MNYLKVFEKVAIRLTDWENHRTRTIYHDSLILKLFSFEFVNNYGPLFYLAYCRNVCFLKTLFFGLNRRNLSLLTLLLD